MNIQQFQYVLAVVDSKNFEDAAERCFVTQSTLSTMINKFEAEIEMKIFNRKTKPVTVTQEGQKIIDRLRIIVNELAELNNVVQELKGEMVGELKIGVIPTLAPYLLPMFINQFSEKFPQVKLIVQEMTTEQIKQSLLVRSLDIGFLALPIAHKELNETSLFNEPFLVYDCSGKMKKNPVTSSDIDYSKICLLEEGHCLRTQVTDICSLSKDKHTTNHNFKFESGSMESLLRITESRKGLTILPYLATKNLSANNKQNIVPFKKPKPVRNIGMLTHHFFVKKALKEALVSIIKKEAERIIPNVDEEKVINPM